MRTLSLIAILSIVLLQLVTVSAPQNPPPAELGVIQGTVKRAGATEPLANAQVSLQGGAVEPQTMQVLLNTAAAQGIVVTPQPGATTSEIVQALSSAAAARGFPITTANLYSQLASLSGRTPPTTTTDRDGRFVFRDLPAGPYTVRVQRDGFFGAPEGGNYPPSAAVDVTVVAKETREVAVSMIPGAIIGGRIFGADGQLMSNANVQVFMIMYQFGAAVMAPLVSKVTDDRGEYRLFWVPPGDYYLGVTPRQAAPAPGTVPQPNPKTFYPGMPTIAEARVITIKGGEDMSGMDIGIRSVPSYKISGQVNNLVPLPAPTLGAPQVSAAVLMLLTRDVNTPDDAGARVIAAVPLLPSSGQFEVANIQPGSYDLFARVNDPSAQVAGGQPFAWGRARFDIRDSDVNNLAITVSSSVAQKGTVTAGAGVKLPAATRVQLLPDGASAKIPAYAVLFTRAAAVGQDGSFSIPAVPEGRFRIGTVAGLTPDLYVADVRQDAMSVYDTGFDVNPRSSSPIEVIVNSGAGTVEGIVLDGPNKPIADATVVLVPEVRRRANIALYLAASSKADGRFTIRGIPPGEYKLFAWESIPVQAYFNPGFLAKYEDRGKNVSMKPASTVTAEVTFIPAVEKK